MGTCVEDISASSLKRGGNGQQRYNYDDLDEGDVDTEGAMPTSTLKTTERAMGHGCLIRVEFLAVHAHAVEWGEGVSMLCLDQMEIFAAMWEIEHIVKMIWI